MPRDYIVVVDAVWWARALMPFAHIAEGLAQLLTLTIWRPGWPLELFLHNTREVKRVSTKAEDFGEPV